MADTPMPEGFVVVPRESTEAMLEAGAVAYFGKGVPLDGPTRLWMKTMVEVWHAMLAAAPSPDETVVERLRVALEPFAKLRMSCEAEVSDLLHRSPAEALRLAALAIEERDNDIRRARAALAAINAGDGEGEGGRG